MNLQTEDFFVFSLYICLFNKNKSYFLKKLLCMQEYTDNLRLSAGFSEEALQARLECIL